MGDMTSHTTTTVKHTHERPTDKQVAYAERLARRKGYRALWEAEQAFGISGKVQGCNRADYSRLIDWLSK